MLEFDEEKLAKLIEQEPDGDFTSGSYASLRKPEVVQKNPSSNEKKTCDLEKPRES